MTGEAQFVSDPERLTRLLGFPYKEPPTIPSLVTDYSEGCGSWEDFVRKLKSGRERERDDVKKAALEWIGWQARKLARGS